MQPYVQPEVWRCPTCKSSTINLASFYCNNCKQKFSETNGIYKFVEDQNTKAWDIYWNKAIPIYDALLNIVRKIVNVQLCRYIENKLGDLSVTLEPGAGSAYVSAMLAEKGHFAFALDYASAPLIIAKEKLNSKARLVQGDVFNMPFADNSFDITFNNSTLEHFDNPLGALKEMIRVTKEGKYVFVGVPYTYGPLAIFKLKKTSFKGAWDGKTYNCRELKRMFADAGMKIEGSRTFLGRCFIGVLGKKKKCEV